MSTILEDVDRFCRKVRAVRRLLNDIRKRDERIKQLLKDMEQAEKRWRTRRKEFRRAPDWESAPNG